VTNTELIAALTRRASEGCEGMLHESCWKTDLPPDKWCDPCRCQEAAKRLTACEQRLAQTEHRAQAGYVLVPGTLNEAVPSDGLKFARETITHLCDERDNLERRLAAERSEQWRQQREKEAAEQRLLAVVAVLDKWVPLAPSELKTPAERVDAELSDLFAILDEVPKVYDHVTRSRISKPNTAASAVISAADAIVNEDVEEAVKEATEQVEAALASVRALPEQWEECADREEGGQHGDGQAFAYRDCARDLAEAIVGVDLVPQASCQWSIDDVGGESSWESACKRDFYFDGADGPVDAGFTHCPFCGQALTEHRTSMAVPQEEK